ncbi:endonuclease III [Candidatus Bathyarchaeota archaeon]|nr:MAG: endonuclease III [Candidatus Bathyarchaeota archaeon]
MTQKSKQWMLKILRTLEKHFGKVDWNLEDPFKLLVATILSQHTSDKNSYEACKRLEEKFEVKPEVLAKKSNQEIERLIMPAGLWKIKAKRIKEVSKKILEIFDGDFSRVFNLPLEDARKILLSLPGVGEKTADVLLVFSGQMPVVPVDTHLFTLARRLGISDSEKYEDVKLAYEKLIPPNKRGEAHLLLLNLGKRYCVARKPKCKNCPIMKLCPYPRKTS